MVDQIKKPPDYISALNLMFNEYINYTKEVYKKINLSLNEQRRENL